MPQSDTTISGLFPLPAADVAKQREKDACGSETSRSREAPAILRAAAGGDVVSLKRLLSHCIPSDVNHPDPDSATRQTPLIAASKSGNKGVVQALLDCSCVDVNARGGASHSTFPLLEAARNGRAEVVELLLRAPDVDVNQRGLGGEPLSSSPLLAAAARGHEKVVRWLLAAPAIDVNAAGSHAKTPLRTAAGAGHKGIVEALLAASGIEANLADLEGRTPLFAASQAGHKAVVEVLLRFKGIKPHQQDLVARATPLFAAAAAGHAPVVHTLLNVARADPNKPDLEGRRPLLAAASAGHCDCVLALLCAPGVKPNDPGPGGMTPLVAAASGGHLDTVNALLSVHGIFPNKADERAVTPLWGASASGHTDVVVSLLRAPWINAALKGPNGSTPLQAAASHGHAETVEVLLLLPHQQQQGEGSWDLMTGGNKGSLVNVPDVYGRTPLFAAASAGHEAATEALLRHPCIDPVHRDNTGWTPLHAAASAGHAAVLGALLCHPGTDPALQDPNGMTAANVACAAGHQVCVELLRNGRRRIHHHQVDETPGASSPVLSPPAAGPLSPQSANSTATAGPPDGGETDDPAAAPELEGSFGAISSIGRGVLEVAVSPGGSNGPLSPPLSPNRFLPGPLRHPGTCRGTAAVLLKRPSTACSVAAIPTDHARTLLEAEAVASPPFLSLNPRQQHQQVQSQGTPAARPATAQPSSGTRGSERRLELLQRCRPPLGSASSLIVETGDDVALLDRGIWSSKGQQSGPYEDARKRLEGRHSGYIRHALPKVLNRAVLMNMKAGGAPHDTDIT